MVDWIIEELRYKAKIFKETGAVSVLNGDVVKSDSAVPSSVKASLRDEVKSLENIPEVYRDYHPGSDGKVADLVHPSLFPLVYGQSRVLSDTLIGLDNCVENCGRGDTIAIPPEDETVFIDKTGFARSHYLDQNAASPYSNKFQWLPCEVEIHDKSGAK